MTLDEICRLARIDDYTQAELGTLIADQCMLSPQQDPVATTDQLALFKRFHKVALFTIVEPPITAAIARAIQQTEGILHVDVIAATVTWFFLQRILPSEYRLPCPPKYIAKGACIILAHQREFKEFCLQAAGTPQLVYYPPVPPGYTYVGTKQVVFSTVDEITTFAPITLQYKNMFVGIGEQTSPIFLMD